MTYGKILDNEQLKRWDSKFHRFIIVINLFLSKSLYILSIFWLHKNDPYLPLSPNY